MNEVSQSDIAPKKYLSSIHDPELNPDRSAKKSSWGTSQKQKKHSRFVSIRARQLGEPLWTTSPQQLVCSMFCSRDQQRAHGKKLDQVYTTHLYDGIVLHGAGIKCLEAEIFRPLGWIIIIFGAPRMIWGIIRKRLRWIGCWSRNKLVSSDWKDGMIVRLGLGISSCFQMYC